MVMLLADEAPSGSALRLLLAAERLFAVHGIDGVSLRKISVASGSGNNSAVHYHFGSKEGLIEAILLHRIPQLVRERRLLALQSAENDVRSRFGAHYLPLLQMAEARDNNYVSFVEQLQRRRLADGSDELVLPDEGRRSDDEFRRDIGVLLPDVDPDVRALRIRQAQLLCLHAAVDREHAVAGGPPAISFEQFVNSLLDGIAGFLLGP